MTILSIPAWYLTPRPVTDIIENWMEMRWHLKWNRMQEAEAHAEKMFTATFRVGAAAGLALLSKWAFELRENPFKSLGIASYLIQAPSVGQLRKLALCSCLLIGAKMGPSFFLAADAYLLCKCIKLSLNSYSLRQRTLTIIYGASALMAYCFLQIYKDYHSRDDYIDQKIQQGARRMARWLVF